MKMRVDLHHKGSDDLHKTVIAKKKILLEGLNRLGRNRPFF